MRGQDLLTVEAVVNEAHRDRRLAIARNRTESRRFERLAVEGKLLRPVRGMFANATIWHELNRSERALCVARTFATKYPEWTFCSVTAALLHGLEVPGIPMTPVHIAVPLSWSTRATRNVMRHALSDTEECFVDKVRVVSLERAVLDCLIALDFASALAVADSALRLTGLPKNHFINYVRAHTTELGWKLALDPLAWASALAESGGESMARAVMIEQGYAVPKLQVVVSDPLEAGRVYRCDFFWELADGTRVAGELDGREKYRRASMTGGRDAVDVLADERLRESRLGAADLRVMRFSYADVQDVRRLTQLMDLYEIPRGPMRPRGRRL